MACVGPKLEKHGWSPADSVGVLPLLLLLCTCIANPCIFPLSLSLLHSSTDFDDDDDDEDKEEEDEDNSYD